MHLIKWTRVHPRLRETLSLRDAAGREVARFSDYRVEVADWTATPRQIGKVILVTTWSGGAHGSNCYYLYSIGKDVRCLLAYRKGDLIDEDDFEARDLDHDGVPEIVSWYDGFAYGARVPGWECSYDGSARIPVVFRWDRGRYVDATRHYRKWLRGKHSAARRKYSEDRAQSGRRSLPDTYHRLVECYAIERLLYPDTARQHIARLAAGGDWAAFRRKIAQVDAVLAGLRQRVAYPEPYRQMPDWHS